MAAEDSAVIAARSRQIITGPQSQNGTAVYLAHATIHTLMFAFTSSRQVDSWLSLKRLLQALPGRAGSAVVETTVDHTLMRGSEPHDR